MQIFRCVLFLSISCCSYHTGSLAFGSLIIAVVQMVRIVLEYLDHKLKGKLRDIDIPTLHSLCQG